MKIIVKDLEENFNVTLKHNFDEQNKKRQEVVEKNVIIFNDTKAKTL
jgi:hypothetical protein